MIRWNVRRLAEARGIVNANQLAKRAGLGWPTARRLWSRRQPQLQRIEVSVLEALARALDVEPWQLLDHRRTSVIRGKRSAS